MEPRRSRRHIKPVPPSLADMDGDVILHMCELVCSPLGDSFTLVPRMSETCKRLHALLRPMLHELRPAVRAISALEALGSPRWTLRQRCLRLSMRDEGFCYVNEGRIQNECLYEGPWTLIQNAGEGGAATSDFAAAQGVPPPGGAAHHGRRSRIRWIRILSVRIRQRRP